MYWIIIVIGYAYVILVVAVSAALAGSWFKALAIFVGLGLVPVWLVAKVFARRAKPALRADAGEPDRRDAEQDQQKL